MTRNRMYRIWSRAEELALQKGVQTHGVGAWEIIRQDPQFECLRDRTGVQLKDKWRNLVKFKHLPRSLVSALASKPKASWRSRGRKARVQGATAQRSGRRSSFTFDGTGPDTPERPSQKERTEGVVDSGMPSDEESEQSYGLVAWRTSSECHPSHTASPEDKRFGIYDTRRYTIAKAMAREVEAAPDAEAEYQDAVVDCPCGVNYDDGLMMIECERCKTWAHVQCLKAQQSSLPDWYRYDFERYECAHCQSPGSSPQQPCKGELGAWEQEEPCEGAGLDSDYGWMDDTMMQLADPPQAPSAIEVGSISHQQSWGASDSGSLHLYPSEPAMGDTIHSPVFTHTGAACGMGDHAPVDTLVLAAAAAAAGMLGVSAAAHQEAGALQMDVLAGEAPLSLSTAPAGLGISRAGMLLGFATAEEPQGQAQAAERAVHGSSLAAQALAASQAMPFTSPATSDAQLLRLPRPHPHSTTVELLDATPFLCGPEPGAAGADLGMSYGQPGDDHGLGAAAASPAVPVLGTGDMNCAGACAGAAPLEQGLQPNHVVVDLANTLRLMIGRLAPHSSASTAVSIPLQLLDALPPLFVPLPHRAASAAAHHHGAASPLLDRSGLGIATQLAGSSSEAPTTTTNASSVLTALQYSPSSGGSVHGPTQSAIGHLSASGQGRAFQSPLVDNAGARLSQHTVNSGSLGPVDSSTLHDAGGLAQDWLTKLAGECGAEPPTPFDSPLELALTSNPEENYFDFEQIIS